MLDLLSIFLGHSNTVTMVPFLTIVTTTVGEERENKTSIYLPTTDNVVRYRILYCHNYITMNLNHMLSSKFIQNTLETALDKAKY